MLGIITITKNDLKGITKTISSTKELRLNHGVTQTIIDSSDDNIASLVEDLISYEDNIKYVRQPASGISSAFNFGINMCNSEWIWFLNGGDEVHPEADLSLLANILNKSRSDVIIFDIEMMDSGVKTKHPPLWASWPPLYWVPHPSTLVKRDLFHKYGCFNSDYKIAMDGELWVRLFSKDTIVDMISIPLSLYDQNGVSNIEIVKVNREADMIILGNFRLLFRIWLNRGSYLFKAIRRRIFRFSN